jgi:pimeloyl-ACP methyl ester carboxylesterase
MIGTSEIFLPLRFRGSEYRLSARFRDAGQDLVIFVHGLGCSKDSWRNAWARRELRDKSLLAYDLVGFGHSPRPADFDYALENQAELLSAIIDAYAVRRIHLVAHSMGGTIALLLPPRTLARLESLTLVEPRLMKSSCGIAAEARLGDYDRFRSEVLPRFRQRISRDPRVVFDLGRADSNAFYKSACSLIHWTHDHEMTTRFAHAPCRKVLVYGGLNRHLEELGFVDDLSKFEVPDAGHFVMHDEPDMFFQSLTAWLSKHD